MTLSQILGSLLCSLIPITFVDLGEGVPKETSRKQIWMTFLGEFIAVVIVALLTFAFFGEGTTRNSILRQEKYQRYKVKMLAQGLVPKKYKKGARGTQSVWIQIKHIMSRPYLIAVVLINALTYGMVVGSGALGTPILTSVGYEQVRYQPNPRSTEGLPGLSASLLELPRSLYTDRSSSKNPTSTLTSYGP